MSSRRARRAVAVAHALRQDAAATAPWQSRADRIVPLALAEGSLVVLAALVLWVAGGPILTNDFWFHLKMGEVYSTQGLWLASDPLLYTAGQDRPTPHEWLFGVGLHLFERAVGLYGLRVVHALAVLGIGWLVYVIFRRESPSPVEACLATSVFVVLSWLRLVQLRPDLVSIAATLAVYRLLLEPDHAPSWPRVVGALGVLLVWVNAHSLFAIGLVLVGAALLGLALRALLARAAGLRPAPTRRALRLAEALLLGLVVTLLNPQGIHQHLSFFTAAKGTGLWQVADDWEHFSPFAPGPYLRVTGTLPWLVSDVLLFAFLVAAALGLVRFWRRPSSASLRAVDPTLLGLGLVSIVAILVSIRFLWMSVFPLLFLLRVLSGALAGRPAASRRVAWALAGGVAVLVVAFTRASAFPLVAANLPARPADYVATPYAPHNYHVEGVRFLRETGVEGHVFNKYLMGGFLGYWLAPRLRTFIDGRYPSDILKDYTVVAREPTRETMLDTLAKRDVDFFFGVGVPMGLGPDEILNTTTHLEGAAGWMLVSRSVHHAIYLRTDERNRENLRRIAAYYAREGVPFDSARGLDVGAVIRARPDWATAHELLPPDYATLLDARRDPSPDASFDALDYLGLVHALLGLYAEGAEFDRQAVALRPGAKAPRRRLVYDLLRLGRWNDALAAAAALRRIDPTDLLSAAAVRQAEAYVRDRTSSPGGRMEPAINQFPVVTDADRKRLFADFYRASLR